MDGRLMNIVKLEVKPDQSAIDLAAELLELAQSGEIVTITAIEERPDGTWRVRGSLTANASATAGRLLAAALERLEQTK
jgi:hypothetical protein